MPQMAPIGWLSLFMIFSLVFLLFNVMNYYCFIPTSPKLHSQKSIKINTFNWKW